MCEHYVARAAAPFQLDELWDFTARLERYGIAGFGWGAAWLTDAGRIQSHRDTASFEDDRAGRARVGAQRTTAALVHLRRPSKLSTLGIADAQPFDDPAGRFSFSHNGDLKLHRDWRGRYAAQGRIKGRADTEVGARWLEDEWQEGEPIPRLLGAVHDTFGGLANLAVLVADGSVHHYAGNDENPVFTFRLGEIGLASTGIYSIDRSVFTFVAPTATERHVVPLRSTASLDVDGRPSAATRRPRDLVTVR
jgi:glutamine phosphoribosylpyrophosphate amidotransferase